MKAKPLSSSHDFCRFADASPFPFLFFVQAERSAHTVIAYTRLSNRKDLLLSRWPWTKNKSKGHYYLQIFMVKHSKIYLLVCVRCSIELYWDLLSLQRIPNNTHGSARVWPNEVILGIYVVPFTLMINVAIGQTKCGMKSWAVTFASRNRKQQYRCNFASQKCFSHT